MEDEHIIIKGRNKYQTIYPKKNEKLLAPKPNLFLFSLFNLYKDKALQPICLEENEFIDCNCSKSL